MGLHTFLRQYLFATQEHGCYNVLMANTLGKTKCCEKHLQLYNTLFVCNRRIKNAVETRRKAFIAFVISTA